MTRFAFYGRVSTEDQQDPESSRVWQLSLSRQLVEPAGGQIVADYFDIGDSRSIPWKRRPESARLLDDFRDTKRGFDAVVIGEPHRAFYGNQFSLTFPVFVHYGVSLWVPEVGGRIDPGSEAHDMVMSIFGGMSKGERMRIQHRVRSAMAAQAAAEGRYLGGRPPYGYQLADAGPHPNPAKAADGKRLHQLEPDPFAAPVVLRIFTDYVNGAGLFAIAENLTRDGIPSPSGHDPDRNRHRASTKGAWSKLAVRAILDNPRYTGRQVWNRQRRDEVLIDVEDVALGHEVKMRWNKEDDWVWSAQRVHEPLVPDELFEQTRQLRAAAGMRAAVVTPRRKNTYVLSSLVHCGVCGRRMQGAWAHGRAYYRCRFPSEYADIQGRHPRSINVRESAILQGLDKWLAGVFDPDRIDDTCAALAAASEPDPGTDARQDANRKKLKDCDARLATYRAALEAGTDPALVGKWIAEVQAERGAAERAVGQATQGQRLTKDQVCALVAALGDTVAALRQADPADKADAYRELGINLTFHPEGTVQVEARPRVYSGVCRRGDTNPKYTRPLAGLVGRSVMLPCGRPSGSPRWRQQTLPTHGHLVTQRARSGRRDSLPVLSTTGTSGRVAVTPEVGSSCARCRVSFNLGATGRTPRTARRRALHQVPRPSRGCGSPPRTACRYAPSRRASGHCGGRCRTPRPACRGRRRRTRAQRVRSPMRSRVPRTWGAAPSRSRANAHAQ
jgi:DNA invertase Pin-like site-specific DNA recombinase